MAKYCPEFRSDAKYVVDLCSMVKYDNIQLLCEKCANFNKTSSNIYSYCVIEQQINEKTSGRTLLILIREILVCIWTIYLLPTLYALCYHVILHMNELEQDELLFFSKICVHYVTSICRQFDQSRY